VKQGDLKQQRRRGPSPAMIVAIIALVLALTGTAFAALGKNSVGTRQLKSKAVTTGKIANNAINAAKVADHSLTGQEINIGALGTVPKATSADSAGNAGTVGGHSAACPAATVLLRGVCFDSSPSPQVASLQQAADACAAKGGYLPTPMALYSTRGVINLGSGIGTDHTYTDSFYGNTTGGSYRTIVIDGTGALSEQEPGAAARYVCAYPLVR
jgi:hypothetical protein